MTPRDPNGADDLGFGESSRYAAHLDRGWSLLARQEYAKARNSAHHAHQINRDVPDASMLLAAIALAEGDPEGALEWYERALEIDGEYVDAHLAALQVRLYDLRDFEATVEHADRAASLSEALPIDRLDFEMLAVEALIAQRKHSVASVRIEAIAELDEMLRLIDEDNVDFDDFDRFAGPTVFDGERDEEEEERRFVRCLGLAIRSARAHLDIGRHERARDIAQLLVERAPDEADTWHLLNEAEHIGGNSVAAIQAGLATARLDANVPLPEWVPDLDQLREVVIGILETGGMRKVRERFAPPQLAVLIHEAPAPELVLEGIDPRVVALALGVRPSAHEPGAPGTKLTGIAVYRRNVPRFSGGSERLEADLGDALREEVASFLGLDDGWRHSLDLPPRTESPKPSAKASNAEFPAREGLLVTVSSTPPEADRPEPRTPSAAKEPESSKTKVTVRKRKQRSAKKPSAKKTSAKKTSARKTSAKKPSAKKTSAKKPSAKKPSAKKPSAKKTSAKKTSAKKTSAKKTSAKKTSAKKTSAKKTSASKKK